jgi:hypothetical protein
VADECCKRRSSPVESSPKWANPATQKGFFIVGQIIIDGSPRTGTLSFNLLDFQKPFCLSPPNSNKTQPRSTNLAHRH